MEARMRSVHTQTGRTVNAARRARDSTARLVGIHGLGLTFSL
jgi:hypothetical protein